MDDVEVVFGECVRSSLRLVTFKADEELVRRLDEYARARGLSRSEVIREAIAEYLVRHSAEQPPRAPRLQELLGAVRLG